jgi:branched-chain amino acid transport system ATP-binding protein
MPMLSVSGLTKLLRRLHGRQGRVVRGRGGRDPRPHRPERLGQEHDLQLHRGHVSADVGQRRLRGRGDRRPRAEPGLSIAGIGRTFQIPRPFHGLSLVENVALSAFFGQDRAVSRSECWRLAEDALATVGLPADGRAGTDGLGAAALKKLELARALATQPRLLLADESLNGLDHGEMEQAADMLRRIRDVQGITIVWVEHIMGVLMRVVDRVGRARSRRGHLPRQAEGRASRSARRRGLSRLRGGGVIPCCR